MYIRYPGATSASISFPLNAPDGSAGAPSYSFSSSPSTGMYYSATQINFSVSGTLKFFISASQINTANDALLIGSNSTSEARISNNITNTGFLAFAGNSTSGSGGVVRVYGSSHATKANFVEFSTAGTSRWHYDASGNLIPDTDVTYNLGSSTNKALNIFGAVVGTTTNNNATAGNVGEYIESVVASQAVGSTGVWTNLTSISLTAGDWNLEGLVTHDPNGGSLTNADQPIAISINSGATTTDQVIGSNVASGTYSSTTGVKRSAAIPGYRLSLSATTTVYLKTNFTYTVGGSLLWGRISARRMR